MHGMVRDPIYMVGSEIERQSKYICHPDLRNGMGPYKGGGVAEDRKVIPQTIARRGSWDSL